MLTMERGTSVILLRMVSPIEPAVPEDTEVVKEATAWTPVSPAAKRNGNICPTVSALAG
jgi:hypothetical protein